MVIFKCLEVKSVENYLKVIERIHLHNRPRSIEGKSHFNTLVRAERSKNLEGTSWREAKAEQRQKEKVSENVLIQHLAQKKNC